MITESQIELQICDALTRRGFFVVKLKDQSAFRNGAYRKGSSYQIRGVPDLVVFAPKGRTLWLEVKTPKGTQSDHQKAFERRILDLGHEYHLVRSVDEALKIAISTCCTE